MTQQNQLLPSRWKIPVCPTLRRFDFRLSVPGSRASRPPRGQDGRATRESIPSSFLLFSRRPRMFCQGSWPGSTGYLGGKGISLLTLTLFLTIPPVQADTSPCNGFMSLGLHNTTYRSDPGQARALVLSQFCSADFTTITDPANYQTGNVGNTKVMEIEASYDVLTNSFSSAASTSNPAFAIARRNSIRLVGVVEVAILQRS